MSSATATDAVISVTDPMERHTYWCHECDLSVSLRPSSSSLLCPHCFGNFLELMDSALSPLSPPPPHSSSDIPFPLSAAAAAADDDNSLLDSPYLHRLVQHLTADDYYSNNPNLSTTNSSSLPASNAAVESLITVKIVASLLELDPLLFCPVCKDQFIVDVEAKQLPCKHLYHPDCILPWLANHSTCPVCRFQLPTRPINPRRTTSGLVATTPLRFGDVLTGEEDWFGYRNTLRYMARRHMHLMSEAIGDENSNLSSLSPTQMAEAAEADMGFVARTSSVETVSSWPVEAGAGSREMDVSGRANEDGGDAPMSDVKVSSSSVS
ncbi:hypothetical protein FEM48_Zijuj01G0024600 [Ziziphus jujuba var. spinosa]|uniref:RING-type E3 ubiquitin transferase n=1 Tax=Ziziphus jujuba var. spinosa TaxID=714518 RepID=A0A978VYL5_ZIZJJ|nr:hypothetical protein FEM48_Zijuj01G0024600 [Ziziphus jujuba var. spinosa]